MINAPNPAELRSMVDRLRDGEYLDGADPLAITAVRFLHDLGPDPTDPGGEEKFALFVAAVGAVRETKT